MKKFLSLFLAFIFVISAAGSKKIDNTLISSWGEYKYNADGNTIKLTLFNADGSRAYWLEYEYDADGNLIKGTYYNANG